MEGITCRDLVFPANLEMPDEAMTDLEGLCPYPPDAPPLFFGHYLKPPALGVAPEASNVACLDYSAAKGGPLVAYRWAGETSLLADHFVRSDGESGKVI